MIRRNKNRIQNLNPILVNTIFIEFCRNVITIYLWSYTCYYRSFYAKDIINRVIFKINSNKYDLLNTKVLELNEEDKTLMLRYSENKYDKFLFIN